MSATLTKSLIYVLLTLDKDDSSWEVMSSTSDRGYSRVMTRLLKKSNQLTMVLDFVLFSYSGSRADPICQLLMMQCLLCCHTYSTSQSKINVLLSPQSSSRPPKWLRGSWGSQNRSADEPPIWQYRSWYEHSCVLNVLIISLWMQEDSPLVTVRLRVVKLLGHLGGKLNRSLVTGKDLPPKYLNYTVAFWVLLFLQSDTLRTLDCEQRYLLCCWS